ncbi:peptidoglycan glycosyltransferase MrdB [Candidatus Pantoea carbekii]|uniref:Peptidoglycan glycosyltransferase MrdB n=1 Tax=Candidatus Pantoea carbekii TaxID=1235990 RepID=U3U8N0_9GAMM|nr:peptidoglycan glycosyltransferase MrdB [Candidatus Pantoea carbekii]AKC32210.1 Rod shape-determining protein RodA [Candidatus Pantoea carbekii]BAO00744.1 cell wall shape-determining protein [Candidatus Pantoea carbekii]
MPINNIHEKSIWMRIHIDPIFISIIITLLIYSMIITWSASGQNLYMMQRKTIQIITGLVIMLAISQLPPRIYENWAPYLYTLCIILLITVDAFGHISKGARRWLDVGLIRFQPSELAKIVVPLMVSRFINRHVCPPTTKNTWITLIIIFIPVLLVAAQPDLGTAVLITASGLFVLFLSGISWKMISITLILCAVFSPILWFFFMQDYQRDRVIMLLNAESDPLGAGYHIIQSKIAIGSGGLFGKGWLHGTQVQLDFLPECHTDFILSVLAEEFGLVGVLLILLLYILLIIRGMIMATCAQTTFGRVMIGNLMLILFVYIFVNMGMVSGILPVVGIPLPLMSYGGSALIMLMTGFGIIMSIHTHPKMLSKNI